jgi:hypothetical protein
MNADNGIQEWMVPIDGLYNIIAYDADARQRNGGFGAIMMGGGTGGHRSPFSPSSCGLNMFILLKTPDST